MSIWNTAPLKPLWMHFWSQRLRRLHYLILDDLAQVIPNPYQPFTISGWRSIQVPLKYNFKATIRFSIFKSKHFDPQRSFYTAIRWCMHTGHRKPTHYLISPWINRLPRIDITALLNWMAQQYAARNNPKPPSQREVQHAIR